MSVRRSWSWLAALAVGYALFYGVLIAEAAFALPRNLNPDCIAMVSDVLALALRVAPVHWLAVGPAQEYPHLGLALFLVAVALLAAGYLGALRAVRRCPEAWPLGRLLRWSALAALPLLGLLPPTSADYLAYLFAGRVLSVYHLSPWHHTLAQFPAEHRYLSPLVWGPGLSCIYGPVWVAVMGATTGLCHLLAPGELAPGGFMLNVLALRLANVAALGLAAAAIWQIQGLLWPRQQRLVTAAFLLNPLVVYESLGALHNDLWGVALLLWAAYLFLRDDRRFVLPLALSILTKYVILAIVPLIGVYYLRRRERGQLGGVLATALLCLGLTYLTDPTYLTSRLLGSTGVFGISPTSLPQFLVFVGNFVRELAPSDTVPVVARVLTALFVPVYAMLLWRTRTREQVLVHGLWALGLYLTGVYLQTMQWYYVWPLGLLCATRLTRAAAQAAWASTCVLLGYVMYFWNHNGWTGESQVAGFLLAIVLPALVCLAGRAGLGTACAPIEEDVPGGLREGKGRAVREELAAR